MTVYLLKGGIGSGPNKGNKRGPYKKTQDKVNSRMKELSFFTTRDLLNYDAIVRQVVELESYGDKEMTACVKSYTANVFSKDLFFTVNHIALPNSIASHMSEKVTKKFLKDSEAIISKSKDATKITDLSKEELKGQIVKSYFLIR